MLFKDLATGKPTKGEFFGMVEKPAREIPKEDWDKIISPEDRAFIVKILCEQNKNNELMYSGIISIDVQMIPVMKYLHSLGLKTTHSCEGYSDKLQYTINIDTASEKVLNIIEQSGYSHGKNYKLEAYLVIKRVVEPDQFRAIKNIQFLANNSPFITEFEHESLLSLPNRYVMQQIGQDSAKIVYVPGKDQSWSYVIRSKNIQDMKKFFYQFEELRKEGKLPYL